MASVTVYLKAPFKYRFTCEKCGKQTDWLNADISSNPSRDVGVLGDKSAAAAELTRQFWDKYPEKIKNISEGNYEASNGLDGKCPACGSRQSWEAGQAASSVGVGLAMMIILPLFGWGAIALPSGKTLGALLMLVLGVILIACGVVGLILFIAGLVKRSRIKDDMAQTTTRNKPEFQFPAPPQEFRVAEMAD